MNRILAVAVKLGEGVRGVNKFSCQVGGLTLVGFITFADPLKASSYDAVKRIQSLGVSVRMLTGDAENVAKSVASKVGIKNPSYVMLGSDIDTLLDRGNFDNTPGLLKHGIQSCHVFARLTPKHKRILVEAFQSDHVVGFLGDGINDCGALHTAGKSCNM